VTALADWLFYLHAPGMSVAIFVAGLRVTAVLTNPCGRKTAMVAY
jgi:hypothetical protein